MNLVFEIGIPLALVLGAALVFNILRRMGKHLDEEDNVTHTSGT